MLVSWGGFRGVFFYFFVLYITFFSILAILCYTVLKYSIFLPQVLRRMSTALTTTTKVMSRRHPRPRRTFSIVPTPQCTCVGTGTPASVRETTRRPSRSVAVYIRKEGNVLFNDALNTFYLQLYGRKEMFYLTTHSTHFIYSYMEGRKCFI